jgi:excinuclease ABC subunit C
MSTTHNNLSEKLSLVPESPGIYIFKDANNRIIYVGKSTNLKERLKSYFHKGADTRYQIGFLKDKIFDFEFILTGTEKEALILENEFIKKYKPRFNIKLRDDKSFVNIRISKNHDFPRIHVVRKPEVSNSIVFGPYSSAKSARKTLKLLLRAFPLRSCSDDEFKRRTRPCILYDIHECSAPCVNYIDKEQYSQLLKKVILFLKGRRSEILQDLKSNMETLARQERFEDAAKVRDQIRALEKTLESQRIVSSEDIDRDVFAVASSGNSCSIGILNVRQGVLQNVRNVFIKRFYQGPEETLATILSQYYDSGNFIPDEVIIDRELENIRVIEERLQELSGNKVRILTPLRGERRDLIALAETNANDFLRQKLNSPEGINSVLKEIEEVFHLPRTPRIIEAIDISNISGKSAVGSKVAFVEGRPEKSLYRLYRIKTVAEIDDYRMMYEVIKRRFESGIENNDLPDLMLIDGGKGHLQIAVTAMEDAGYKDVSIVSIAKGERNKTNKMLYVDHFYLPGVMNPVFFKNNSRALFLLQRIRDEAHRFAIKYHRKLRSINLKSSILDSIEGIGEKRKTTLLSSFGSIEMLKKASIEEIIKTGKIPRKVAMHLYETLHR